MCCVLGVWGGEQGLGTPGAGATVTVDVGAAVRVVTNVRSSCLSHVVCVLGKLSVAGAVSRAAVTLTTKNMLIIKVKYIILFLLLPFHMD